MAPDLICRQLYGAGLHIRSDGEKLLVSPVERLTDETRQLLREHKPELIAFVADAHKTTVQLIEAAIRACDHHGDIEKGRAEMRADCLATPLHLQADLLAYFREQYGRQA